MCRNAAKKTSQSFGRECHARETLFLAGQNERHLPAFARKGMIANSTSRAPCGRRRCLLNSGVLFRKKNRPHERFYLLPGQGGKNYHRKQRQLLLWSVIVSLLFGAVLAAGMWYMSRPKL
jgi:hypothetical protein